MGNTNIILTGLNALLTLISGTMLYLAARASRKNANWCTLMEFLHRSEFRNARMEVLDSTFPSSDLDKDKKNGWIICSSFDFAGSMVERNLIDRKAFFQYWGPVLCLLDKKIRPFLNSERFNGITGEKYWEHFLYLLTANEMRQINGKPISLKHQ